MAVLSQSRNGASGPMAQHLLNETKLQAAQPKAVVGKVTIFRPIPEVAADGSILPMVRSITPSGFDFSNVRVESAIIGACNLERNKYATLMGQSSDAQEEKSVHQIFPGLFIRLRKQQKDNKLPDNVFKAVTNLLARTDQKGSCIPSTTEYGFHQVILLQLNGETFDKPRPRQCLILTSAAITALNALYTECAQRNIDIFDPEAGYTVKLTPQPGTAANPKITSYVAELGDQVALTQQACREMWAPWDVSFKRMTQAQMLQQAVSLYGEDVVLTAFPEHQSIIDSFSNPKQAAPAPAPAPAPVAQKPAQQRTAPVAMQIDTSMPAPMQSDDGDDGGDIIGAATAQAPAAPKAPVVTPAQPDEMAKAIQAQLEAQMGATKQTAKPAAKPANKPLF